MSSRIWTGNWWLVAVAFGIAAVGGGVGASLMWVIAGQWGVSGAVIGFLITALGWFVSARLTERAHTRLFQHNIINTARLDLAKQIREEQEWIGQLLNLGFLYRGSLINRKNQRGPLDPNVEKGFWIEQSRKGHEVLYRRQDPGRTLTMLLEEYEILFPETIRVRHQLSNLSQQIATRYGSWLLDLYELSKCEATIITLENRLGSEDGDYSALLEDLRIHVQNSALSKIMNRTVGPRKPQETKLPIMIMQADGLLDIVQNGQSWPIMSEAYAKLLNRKSVHWPL